MTWIRELTHSFPTNSRLHPLQISWITCHLQCIRLDSIKELRNLILALPQSHRGFLRIADAAQWGRQHKLAMLSFACAYERSDDQKVQTYCVKRMIECSKDTEWGPVMLEDEVPQIPFEIASILLTSWSKALLSALSDISVTPSLMYLGSRCSFRPPTLHPPTISCLDFSAG